MAAPFIQEMFAQRLGGRDYGKSTGTYKFARIKAAKEAARKERPDVALIDLGVGEPDEMAFPVVVDALCAAAAKPENRGYADNGGMPFREAAARHMQQVYGVTLDPATEVLHSIGSKTALSMLPACFIDPGDVVLMTVPGYPVFGTHAQYYGGVVENLPLARENDYLPDLDAVPHDVLARTKVLVLNYPNNPTGAMATREFFQKAVALAHQHQFLILQDAAYAALTFGDTTPVSILQVDGAREVSLELHSLSKACNMTGWRLGWVCGDALLVKAYGDVKDNSDSGQFLAIQEAGVAALDNPSITREIAAKYDRRMDGLTQVLTAAGFPVQKPAAGFFLYTPAPVMAVDANGRETPFANGEAFSQWLIREELISTVPWDEAGAHVRFSVTFASPGGRKGETAVLTEIADRLQKYTFRFA